jgi:hypothetical protein
MLFATSFMLFHAVCYLHHTGFMLFATSFMLVSCFLLPPSCWFHAVCYLRHAGFMLSATWSMLVSCYLLPPSCWFLAVCYLRHTGFTLFADCFMVPSCLTYSLNKKKEATCSRKVNLFLKGLHTEHRMFHKTVSASSLKFVCCESELQFVCLCDNGIQMKGMFILGWLKGWCTRNELLEALFPVSDVSEGHTTFTLRDGDIPRKQQRKELC